MREALSIEIQNPEPKYFAAEIVTQYNEKRCHTAGVPEDNRAVFGEECVIQPLVL